MFGVFTPVKEPRKALINLNKVPTLPSCDKANIPQGWSFLVKFPTGMVATGHPAQAEKDISVASDEESTISRPCSRIYLAMLPFRASWRKADTAMSCFSSVMAPSRHLISSVWVSNAGNQNSQGRNRQLAEIITHVWAWLQQHSLHSRRSLPPMLLELFGAFD